MTFLPTIRPLTRPLTRLFAALAATLACQGHAQASAWSDYDDTVKRADAAASAGNLPKAREILAQRLAAPSTSSTIYPGTVLTIKYELLLHMASLDERMHDAGALEKDYLDAIAQFDDGRPTKEYPYAMRGELSNIQIFGDKLPQPMEKLIQLYIDQNRFDEALVLAQRAGDLGSKSWRYPSYAIMLYQAQIHIKQGKLDVARDEVAHLENMFPRRYAPGFDIEVEKTAATFHKLVGDDARADAAEKKVNELKEKYPDAKVPFTGVEFESGPIPVESAQPLGSNQKLQKICRLPHYPWVSSMREDQGVSQLELEVDENGDLTRLQPVGQSSRLLMAASEEAIASCRFLPQIVDSKPSKTTLQIGIGWRLQ